MIDIKPINILVGKNSSGKSTFLRTFPLFKQSAMTRTSKSPILWNGDVIDFGDFNTSVRKGRNNIYFDFIFNDLTSEFFFPKRNYENSVETIEELRLIISIEEKNNKTLNNILISFDNISLSICYDDNDELLELKIITAISEYSLFNKKTNKVTLSLRANFFLVPNSFGVKTDTDSFYSTDLEEIFKNAITDENKEIAILLVKKLSFEPTDSEEVIKLIESILPLLSFDNDNSSKLSVSVKDIILNYLSFELEIRDLIVADKDKEELFWKKISEDEKIKIIDELDQLITQFFLEDNGRNSYLSILRTLSNTVIHFKQTDIFIRRILDNLAYIAPLRAISERFYRNKNLNIDEIDSSGSNLPMFLNSLGKADSNNLNTWLNEYFSFRLKSVHTGQHYEIQIKEDVDNDYYNISDKGFGFSQLLPIIVSIWMSQRRKVISRKIPKIYAIEQPELHLHPALQYKFGLMLANIIKSDSSNNIQFIIETHSKSIIDGLGDAIKDNVIDNEKVNIYIFDKNEERETKVQRAYFSEEGYLRNWPIGFFTP